MKSLKAPVKRIEKKTWVEKVTDDTNHWLMARNLEKDGLLKDAVRHYLKDASEQRKKNIVRSALSTSCSGRCLIRQGRMEDASRQFSKAVELYGIALESAKSNPAFREWLSKRIDHCRKMASVAKHGIAGRPSGVVT